MWNFFNECKVIIKEILDSECVDEIWYFLQIAVLELQGFLILLTIFDSAYLLNKNKKRWTFPPTYQIMHFRLKIYITQLIRMSVYLKELEKNVLGGYILHL